MSSPPPTSPPPMVWPAPPGDNVVPFPLPWGQTGCCPPGGMSSLMQCYNDIQAATAFICSVMVTCIQTNPAIIAAIIAAIEKSGSSVPLIGVTNGSDAQPGQVGEWVRTMTTLNVPATVLVQTITLAVLQPGDWDCWVTVEPESFVSTTQIELNPQPAGFSDNMYANTNTSGTADSNSLFGGVTRASISVPTLVALQIGTNQYGTGAAATINVAFSARRVR